MHSSKLILQLRLLSLVLGFIFFVLASSVFAQETPKKSDVRLIIDVSGSMKKNDPNNLRLPAVDLLVRLLPEGSKAGVWTFGKYVNMLIPHKVVDEQWRQMARSKAGDINSVGLFTNIGGALEKAAHDKSRPSDEFSTSVILLTDGMVDVSKSPEDNQKEWRRIVDKVLPSLKNANYTIHTVALSKNADTNLLEKMSVMTDGTSAIAYTAEDLMKIFLKAFDVAAPSQQVPLEGNTFAVDSSVEEFTALIFRTKSKERTQLVGPDKEAYNSQTTSSDVAWLRTDKYDLITVKRPIEGEWTLQASLDPDSRVTIVSDMTLRVKSLPNNVFKGAQERLSFVLQEEGETITRKDFLSLLNSTVNVAYGANGAPTSQLWSHTFDVDKVNKKGVFQVDLPELDRMGVYDLELLVDGQTFKRTFNHTITVREPFTASLEKSLNESGIEQYVLTVRSHSDTIDIKRTQIAATVVNPKRRKIVKPLSFTEFDHWQTVLHADVPGLYKVRVQITGEDTQGVPFEYALSPLEIKYNPDAAFDEEELPELEVVKPEPEPVEVEPEEPEVEERVQEQEDAVTEQVAPQAEEALPPWLMYAALALGNLVILGGGYFLFRKLSSSGSEEDILSELSDEEEPSEEVAEPPLEPLEESPEKEPEASVDSMSMDDSGADDEAPPPMEDLEGILASEEQAASTPSDESDSGAPPLLEDDIDVDDFGVDDLEDVEESLTEEEREDMEAEMRQTQGLDLAEDELDDAINNLIDDLDESREEGDTAMNDDLDDLSGIDFEDDD